MSTSWVVDDLVDDAAELFDGPLDDLVAVLEEIASLGDVEAPTPSAELALLLAGRPAGAHHPARRTRRHRRLAPVLGGLAAAAVAGVTLTGTAAYANELPPSVQRVVAHLSEDYLPFTFPRPVGDPPAPRATPRGAGARSTGGATPGTDPSAIAKSGVVPVSPSAGSPTNRADGRLLRQNLPQPTVTGPSAVTRPAPVQPDSGPVGATVGQDTGASAVTMTPPAPPAQASEPPADPTADPTAPASTTPVDPTTAPSGATSAPPSTDPVPPPATDPASGPASGPATDPASGPASGPATDPASGPATDPASAPPSASSGSEPSTTPDSGTPAPTASDGANGKTLSPTVGPDEASAGPTETAPPDGETDEGGSQPTGQVSASPDTSPGTPAVGSGGSPAADLVTDPGTAGSAAPATPSP